MSYLITIITINLNHKKGLQKTFDSVFNQTCQDFEYIVIDGASADGSKQLIEEHADKIDYWVSEPDTGEYNAMNKGIRKATGKYLLFMNSGDSFYETTSLSAAIKYLKGDKSLYYGDFFHEELGIVLDLPSELSFQYFFKSSICHQATFIKKQLFFDYFMYNEDNKIVSDWEFFVYVVCKANESYKHVPIVIASFEQAGISSFSEKTENTQQHLKEREEIFKKHFPAFYDDYVNFNELNKASNQLVYELNKYKEITFDKYNTIVFVKYKILSFLLNRQGVYKQVNSLNKLLQDF